MGATSTRIGQVWAWLGEVADPEIPVISIIDLGIVRKVEWDDVEDAECVVTITPTYSGCPAMLVIAESIADTLHRHGIRHFRMDTQLSPAWTTDWMSEAGKHKLQAYGIAPPVRRAGDYRVIDISALCTLSTRAEAVRCPNCGADDTYLRSQFASTPCKALYVCRACREPFDHFKTH